MSTSKNRDALEPKRLPRHIAVVMDGNGRWAKKHGLPRLRGHDEGAKAVRAIIEACRELGRIESLTLYAFSTENWRRTKTEVSGLFRLFSKNVRLELDNLHAEDIRVNWIGRLDGLSSKVVADINRCHELTSDNKSMQLNIAINYGSRAEIVDACQSIIRDLKSGALREKDIDEACIGNRLYDPVSQDLDLMIRTGGEARLSNFMLWQASYSELIITRTLWPDFRKRHLHRALQEYQNRGRNFGGRPKS